jgi:hypothetical protein
VNDDAGIWQRTISQATFHTLYQTWFQLSTCKLLPASTSLHFVRRSIIIIVLCWQHIVTPTLLVQ